MRGISGIMGTLYGATEWIMRFSVINILWFVINLPITIIIFIVSFSKSNAGYGHLLYLLPLLPLIPTLFVPSTIAMYATARDWVMKNEQKSLVKTYFLYMKENYKQSFMSGLAILFIWLLWIVDFYYFNKISDLLSILFLIIGLALFAFTINFFSLSVHYQMTSRELIKNTFFVTIGNPLLCFFILTSNLFLFYLSVWEFLFLLPLFTGSLSAYLSFSAFHRFTLKIEKQAMTHKSI
ncbi:YesL family protein [Sporosarcina jiandibaonis]|uniref:YesL family protein n=1 Tax=Sporosarcina jiandibaonis TaxID=2715535 RepID=UPI001557E8DC|nr:DUF624 domain-containing protein [Sporosarcina jiandibaonis]